MAFLPSWEVYAGMPRKLRSTWAFIAKVGDFRRVSCYAFGVALP